MVGRVIRVAVDTFRPVAVDCLLLRYQPFHQVTGSVRAHLRRRERARDRSGSTIRHALQALWKALDRAENLTQN
jgi:hypothetical protein